MRDTDLDQFIDAAATAFAASAPPGSDAERASAEIFRRCQGRLGQQGTTAPARLPVCDWLDPALALAQGPGRAALATAPSRLVPRLAWRRRTGADPADRHFYEGHANTMLLGPGGLEERDDLWFGLSLMAPGVTYVDHHHPPEEVYLSLAPGEWRNARMDWTDPGWTGLIYNPPGILHAMRSGATPFLAFWILPL